MHPTSQAAQILHITPGYLRQLTLDHSLPVNRTPGGHRRFSNKDLNRIRAILGEAHTGDGSSLHDPYKTAHLLECIGLAALEPENHPLAIFNANVPTVHSILKLDSTLLQQAKTHVIASITDRSQTVFDDTQELIGKINRGLHIRDISQEDYEHIPLPPDRKLQLLQPTLSAVARLRLLNEWYPDRDWDKKTGYTFSPAIRIQHGPPFNISRLAGSIWAAHQLGISIEDIEKAHVQGTYDAALTATSCHQARFYADAELGMQKAWNTALAKSEEEHFWSKYQRLLDWSQGTEAHLIDQAQYEKFKTEYQEQRDVQTSDHWKDFFERMLNELDKQLERAEYDRANPPTISPCIKVYGHFVVALLAVQGKYSPLAAMLASDQSIEPPQEFSAAAATR